MPEDTCSICGSEKFICPNCGKECYFCHVETKIVNNIIFATCLICNKEIQVAIKNI